MSQTTLNDLLPYVEIYPESDWKRYSVQNLEWNLMKHTIHPVGLSNLGNSCFMNAVLQCFAYIPGFQNYFSSSSNHVDQCYVNTIYYVS